ncbi:Gfo/Idh/MocA family oxidoreductase, partial [Candidatus Poribacteria bacterium]|nr:Gfo/Idh/MocA family oxidoreductase [Candidatus Poribacteria bacterium]
MLRAGIIGCTGIGREHAAGLAGLENVDVVAACDLNAAAAESFRADMSDFWDDITAYTGHTAMLAEQALDVVTVATGDNAHATLVVDAARAGVRGIFCEKPLATSVADADRMIEAVRDSGAVLSVDHTRRWQPLWRRAYERVTQDDAIGPVRCVIGALNGPRAMLFRNGTHLIDAICWFAGGSPDWVFAHLEDGYEEYDAYAGDGGHVPATEPAVSGY